jgi:hypothetical protein
VSALDRTITNHSAVISVVDGDALGAVALGDTVDVDTLLGAAAVLDGVDIGVDDAEVHVVARVVVLALVAAHLLPHVL